MSETEHRRGLGRGLSALLGEIDPPRNAAADPPGRRETPIELIKANPDQPRRRFVDADMDELVASIQEKGVLQPILVRPDPAGGPGFEIVAGERRWRAAQRGRWATTPGRCTSSPQRVVRPWRFILSPRTRRSAPRRAPM